MKRNALLERLQYLPPSAQNINFTTRFIGINISFVYQFQILKDMIQEADADEKESLQLNLLKLNSTFMVKSENSRLYTPSILSRVPLEHKPSAFCPDSARHSSLITHLPLPAACPTCWSVQRIGKCTFLHLCKLLYVC